MNKIIQVYNKNGHIDRVNLVAGEAAKIIVGPLKIYTFLLEEGGWNQVREENSGSFPLSSTLGHNLISGLGYNNFLGTVRAPNTSYQNTFYFAKPEEGRILLLIQRKREMLDEIERKYKRGDYTDNDVKEMLGDL